MEEGSRISSSPLILQRRPAHLLDDEPLAVEHYDLRHLRLILLGDLAGGLVERLCGPRQRKALLQPEQGGGGGVGDAWLLLLLRLAWMYSEGVASRCSSMWRKACCSRGRGAGRGRAPARPPSHPAARLREVDDARVRVLPDGAAAGQQLSREQLDERVLPALLVPVTAMRDESATP